MNQKWNDPRRDGLGRAPRKGGFVCAALPAVLMALGLCPSGVSAAGQDGAEPPPAQLDTVRLQVAAASSLLAPVLATRESLSAEELARQVNAVDAEDALRYFPSLSVRKRYMGDYNHAVLSSRASGTANSARSAVYADGVLLSNFLGNGVSGLGYPPRWGMVSVDEIERVEVMYGPFSAAHSGNSVGAVVDFQTRMPKAFEGQAGVFLALQPFEFGPQREHFQTWQVHAAVGDRAAGWSWRLHVARTDSESQPLSFATRLLSSGTPDPTAPPLDGAVPATNPFGQPWWLVAAGTQVNSQQEQLKLRLAYDGHTDWHASYVLGLWRNQSQGQSFSYLRNEQGQAVVSGPVGVGGRRYAPLTGADLPASQEELLHALHGWTLKRRHLGAWELEASAILYRYVDDDKRQNAANNPQPGPAQGGPGTLAQADGSGWNTLGLKALWRPAGGSHAVELGLQQERYHLQFLTHRIEGNFLHDAPDSLSAGVQGRTRLQAAYVQDTWQLHPDWKGVAGLRLERWQARDGRTDFSAASHLTHPARQQTELSPKLSLAWQSGPETVLKVALGRALRFPTVGELYGATSSSNSRYINDPHLRPERVWASELGVNTAWGPVEGRLTGFLERTRDGMYTQSIQDAQAQRTVSRVQNVDRIATRGVEAVLRSADWPLPGLDASVSATFTDSVIRANAGFVSQPGDTLGKRQPNIPRWRATAQLAYRFGPDWGASMGVRHTGHQYRSLDNQDVNGSSYQGVSPLTAMDLRLWWQPLPAWHLAVGVDNATNRQSWNFHPYPQRTYTGELKVSL
ncbi:TonB-dependent receptor [Inhella proteolytica]|uniref:TonB-dependent receptor n=1 Tax=Inhella proteolytica TaxID=2795029 RepID=A0A931NHW8_9BURK|nr:TonB-dependent receptor [Inhella proteolytica]MBH9578686.1 TonB-dependent receptor [Inhella proteolytica]